MVAATDHDVAATLRAAIVIERHARHLGTRDDQDGFVVEAQFAILLDIDRCHATLADIIADGQSIGRGREAFAIGRMRGRRPRQFAEDDGTGLGFGIDIRVIRIIGINGIVRVIRTIGDIRLYLSMRLSDIEGIADGVAPDIVAKRGIVDKRIAILLLLINDFIAGTLNIIDRVLLSPTQQHLQRPWLQTWILLTIEELRCRTTRPRGMKVLIAGEDVEIDAGDVAFYLVVGFEALTRIATDGAGAHFAVAVIGLVGLALVLAHRVVASAVVDIAVRRDHLHEVALHVATAEPTLRHQVLAVVAVALTLVGMVLGRTTDDVVR